MGTNPLTIGLPTDEDFDFVLDCATSVTQRGKIEYYDRLGLPTPPGQVIDREGNSLTDSAYILQALTAGEAALTPLGGAGDEMAGYKGYGYAAAVEILSAALAAGNYMKMLTGVQDGTKVPYHLGHFFIAIDTEAFLGRAEFEHTCGEILRALRASEKAPGHDRIYTAGEKEYLVSLERRDGLNINEAVQRELTAVRDDLKMDFRFPLGVSRPLPCHSEGMK